MLGVSVNPAQRGRLIVTNVYPGSPAEQAGLRQGDEIVSIDGEQVDTQRDIQQDLRQHHPGDQVAINIRRDGRDQRLTARLETRDQFVSSGPAGAEQSQFGGERRGSYQDRNWNDQNQGWNQDGNRNRGSQQGWNQDQYQNWNQDQGQNRNRDRYDQSSQSGGRSRMGQMSSAFGGGSHDHPAIGIGLRRDVNDSAAVDDVYEGGPADQAGLRRGDRIIAINGQPVRSPGDLIRQVLRFRAHQPVTLTVMRGNGRRDLDVTLADRDDMQQSGNDQSTGQGRYEQGNYDQGRFQDQGGFQGGQGDGDRGYDQGNYEGVRPGYESQKADRIEADTPF